MNNKKAIIPIVSTILLLIVVVVSVVSFQNWFNFFETSVFTNVGSKTENSVNNIKILDLIGNDLYLKNLDSKSILIKNVKINGQDCILNQNISNNSISVISLDLCVNGINKSKLFVSVLTNNNIFEKVFYNKVKKTILTLLNKNIAINSCWGSVGIANGSIYLYGGENGGWQYNRIQKAPLLVPTSWVDTGYTLSSNIGWTSKPVIINNSIYLFGSVANGGKQIFKAPLSNPANMIDTGTLLPATFRGGYVEVINNTVYFFGLNCSGLGNICMAPVSNIGNIVNGGSSLLGSYFFRTSKYLYTVKQSTPYSILSKAPISNPLNWSIVGNITSAPNLSLYNTGHSAILGNYAYIIGGHDRLDIFAAPLNNMLNWKKTSFKLPINMWGKSAITINNKIYVFGGCDINYHGMNKILTITQI